MMGIVLNPSYGDELRRERVFKGDILIYNALPGLLALVEHAKGMIDEAFVPRDPEKAQYAMPVEEFIHRTAPLKSGFTNGQVTKALLQRFLVEFGCDPERTYYDLPRLRVVPSDDFLTSGVSYAYKAHRDTWYAHPISLVNFWLPVFDIPPECAMSMFPRYFNEAVQNASSIFDYDDWVANARTQAVQHVKQDTRPHPLPKQPIDTGGEFRIAGRSGDVMVFSGCHLHATAPNRAGKTRFSIDFRTVHLDDVIAGRGGPNPDSEARGTTLGDFLRVRDLQPFDVGRIDISRAHPAPRPIVA
jgi:hypothetical protein